MIEGRSTPMCVKAWEDKQWLDFEAKFYNYRKSECYAEYFLPNGDLNPLVLQVVRDKVDKTKTPGSPLKYHMSTNQTVLDNYQAEFDDLICSRVKIYEVLGEHLWHHRETDMYLDTDDAAHAAVALLVQNWNDPVLLGPKGEARKIEKQPRLISQVSLVQNSIARLLFGDALIEEQQHPELPVAVALDIVSSEKTKAMYELFQKHTPVAQSDVQGWEWSVDVRHSWLYYFHLAVIMALYDPDKDVIFPGKEKHFYALIAYAYTVIYRVIQTPNGKLYVPPAGQIASGMLATFSQNSFVRSFLSYEVADKAGYKCKFIMSAGDDNIDTLIVDSRNIYKAMGYKITDYFIKHANEPISFCSTTFSHDGSYQENLEKMVYNMLYSGYDAQSLQSFEDCFRNHPQRLLALEFLAKEGYFGDATHSRTAAQAAQDDVSL